MKVLPEDVYTIYDDLNAAALMTGCFTDTNYQDVNTTQQRPYATFYSWNLLHKQLLLNSLAKSEHT